MFFHFWYIFFPTHLSLLTRVYYLFIQWMLVHLGTPPLIVPTSIHTSETITRMESNDFISTESREALSRSNTEISNILTMAAFAEEESQNSFKGAIRLKFTMQRQLVSHIPVTWGTFGSIIAKLSRQHRYITFQWSRTEAAWTQYADKVLWRGSCFFCKCTKWLA